MAEPGVFSCLLSRMLEASGVPGCYRSWKRRHMRMLERVFVALEIDATTLQQLARDWGARSKPLTVVLSQATRGTEIIGWYGEFADDRIFSAIDDAIDNLSIRGFVFESHEIVFVGTAGREDDLATEFESCHVKY